MAKKSTTSAEANNGKYVPYYRVSTAGQGKSSLGLAAQQNTVKRSLKADDQPLSEFIEVESGKRSDRPQLEAAFALAKQHRSRMLIAKLGMRAHLTLLVGIVLLSQCQRQTDQPLDSTQLALTFKTGYGPFYPGFGFLSPDLTQDPIWGKIYLPLRGLPKHWTRLTKSMIWLNSHQLVYQQVKAGTISPANYSYLQKAWKWIPDTTTLSATPIKCYVYVIKGYDEKSHQWAVMMDSDNDLDFSDETPYYPQTIKPGTIPDQVNQTRTIQYEIFQGGHVKPAQLPMVVKIMGNDFLYSFPQYAVATLRGKRQTHQLFISFGFNRPGFEQTTLIKASSILPSGKIDPQKLVERGEMVELAGVPYRNKGFDVFHDRLTLDRAGPITTDAYSLQPGQAFHPFVVREFRHHTPISLATFKGKYIYIDFWGTWCQGCVEQLPHLKKLYEQVDKTRIEFLGIACHDSPTRLTTFLQREDLAWPQLLSDEHNKLVDRYDVRSFPTTLLLDPDGKIVAKNLHGTALRDKLNEISRPQKE